MANVRHLLHSALATGVTLICIGACGSSRTGFDDGASSSSSSGGEPFGDGGASADAARPRVVAWLKGKVVAPEGTVPVSQAIAYLTSRDPEPIPAGVYCDTCVHLSPFEPYAYTKSDGTFELGAYATGKQRLVVQKGQFRRVREIEVRPGDQGVDPAVTRLPGKTDAAVGDTIPRIAMLYGGYDKIDFTLAKLGVEEFYRYMDPPPPPPPLPPPVAPGIKTGKNRDDLFAELGGYHITLLPCAAGWLNRTDWQCHGPTPAQTNAMRSYVDSGGKLYVTDFAYEAVRQTWPGYVTFLDRDDQPLDDPNVGWGTACRLGQEDTDGTAQDKGLSNWLTAIGDGPTPKLLASFSRIQKVNQRPGYDSKGNPIAITPKIWMTSSIDGQDRPATVSFEQRCGRVLFSTYHCEGDKDGAALLPQEKALLYVLLEVGVCVGEMPPPPPPR